MTRIRFEGSVTGGHTLSARALPQRSSLGPYATPVVGRRQGLAGRAAGGLAILTVGTGSRIVRPGLEAWCSGLTCSPVKAEIAGSNPVASVVTFIALTRADCELRLVRCDLPCPCRLAELPAPAMPRPVRRRRSVAQPGLPVHPLRPACATARSHSRATSAAATALAEASV